MPLHAERRRVGSRAWSNRFTLLVGEGGFPRSIPPTDPVGFPLVLPTWREGRGNPIHDHPYSPYVWSHHLWSLRGGNPTLVDHHRLPMPRGGNPTTSALHSYRWSHHP